MMFGSADRAVAIEGALRKEPPQAHLRHAGGAVQAGDFRLDLSRRTASVRGKELSLSPTEFDVLLFLTSHPTNVVTTSTTLITYWQGRQLRKAEFLEILLSLRRKIALNSGTNSYLETETLVLCRFNPTGSRRP
jgi:two-component system KDP operon response regulator KdpE